LRKQNDIAMNGYLFTAGLTQVQVGPAPGRGGQVVDMLQTWDGCASAIIYGGDAEQAQKRFEAWCRSSSDGENPARVEIKKVVAAQFVDQLLTESGGKPLDWPRISRQVNDILQATAVDDFEQGYWVDINQAVPPGKIIFDVESLKRDLPEDIRSGLNWSPDKKFFFLLSVLSPRPFPAIPADDLEPDAPDGDPMKMRTHQNRIWMGLSPRCRKCGTRRLRRWWRRAIPWLPRGSGGNMPPTLRLAAYEIQIAPCCSFVPVA
jgi:hypothetical protein